MAEDHVNPQTTGTQKRLKSLLSYRWRLLKSKLMTRKVLPLRQSKRRLRDHRHWAAMPRSQSGLFVLHKAIQ